MPRRSGALHDRLISEVRLYYFFRVLLFFLPWPIGVEGRRGDPPTGVSHRSVVFSSLAGSEEWCTTTKWSVV